MDERRAIQRMGFRKWYERELLQSHAHLVLLLMSLVGLLGSIELFSQRDDLGRQLTALLCAGAAAVVGAWSLRRYLYLLGHAQYVADQAVCPVCRTYARWNIEEDEQLQSPPTQLRVRCRSCSNTWNICF